MLIIGTTYMYKSLLLITLFLLLAVSTVAQSGDAGQNGSMALSPARFELEMLPGTERTVLMNLDYRGVTTGQPARIVASLNDWALSKEGLVDYYPANSQPGSACPWIIYSPGEASVTPGTVHQIRVTVSVPANAAAGDHLAALVIEQRPEALKYEATNARRMVVRYRLASVFYIKVGKLTRQGDLYDLLAESTPSGIVVTPKIRNTGNSAVRPTNSLKILDADGKQVADIPESEALPILAGSESARALTIDKPLPVGKYTVKYRIDFQDGKPPVEGVTDVTVRTQVAKTPTEKRPN